MKKYLFKYPSMRKQLMVCAFALSSRKYQTDVWVNKIFPPGMEWDSFDMQINFLFDDSGLSDDPEGAVGILLMENEVEGVKKLISNIDIIFNKYGYRLDDEEYMAKTEWSDVLSAAQALLNLIQINNAIVDFDEASID